MFRKLLGLSMALLALPAFAADISYNYVQLGYEKIDIDDPGVGFDVDGDGFGIGGSFEIGESWFVAVDYAKVDFDFDIEIETMGVGAGWHTEISSATDFYALIQYVNAEASQFGLSDDEDGIGFGIGVRGMVTDKLELGGSISYIDLGDAGDGTSFGANLLYNFTDNFAAGVFLDLEEDATGYGAGVRFYW